MAISAVNSTIGTAGQQLQLQQARRYVDQAEQRASSLQTQASNAQLAAERAQTEARILASQAAQAQSAASMAQAQLQTSNFLSQLGTQINNMLEQVIPKPAAAVTNTQGQTIGAVVNTTA